MRILLLNQFYPPDMAPTGLHLHDLARTLVQRGHQVEVLCSRRSYSGGESFKPSEDLDGVEVNRLWATGFGRKGYLGKLVDYGTFWISLVAALITRRTRPDVILSLTTPPYIGMMGKLAAKLHRCHHANWIMDLYPDVMAAHGIAHKDTILIRMLRKLTRLQLRGASLVLTLGPAMAEKVAHYLDPHFQAHNSAFPNSTLNTPSDLGMPNSDLRPSTSVLPPSLRWIPLWSNEKFVPWPDNGANPLRAQRGWAEGEVVFLYSGNMGLGHRFEEFLQAAVLLGAKGPRWVFGGGGKRRAEIESFILANPATRIELLDYVPQNILRAHLCAADIHLASLDSSWQGLMVPSKVQASFALAKPVLFVGGQDNETAAWILESGGGWVVRENDLEGLMRAIEQALDPTERRKRGQTALRFSKRHFDLKINCRQIAELLESNCTEKAESGTKARSLQKLEDSTAEIETARPMG